MPRVSAAHEQEVRDRILARRRPRLQREGLSTARPSPTSCRESGLSVGAIYTYFSGKDELFRLTCDQIAARGLDELAERLATGHDDRRAAGDRHRPVHRDDRRVRRRTRAGHRSSRPGPRRTASRASARCSPARRERLVGAGQLLLRQGVASGELPAWLDVDAVTRGLPRPARRAAAPARSRPATPTDRPTSSAARWPIVELLLAAATMRRRPPSPRSPSRRRSIAAMAHVQTVLGPIEPDALGFTLPHEHTQIALWHIEGRWDYWQLTRDEPVILEELARFREAGGSGARRPDAAGRRARPGLAASRSPRRAASTSSWAAAGTGPPTTRPRRGSTGARSTTSPTSSSREVDRRGGGAGRPAGDHRRDRDRQAVGLAAEERVHRAAARASRADRAGDHDPRGAVRRRARPAADLRGGGRRPGAGRHRPRRFVPGPRPLPGDHRARREHRVRLPRHAVHADRAARRGPRRRARCASCSRAATPTGSC